MGLKTRDPRRSASLPAPAGHNRWSQAQHAEFGFWTQQAVSAAAIADAVQSRRASTPAEVDFFDNDGKFSKRLASAGRVVEVGAGPVGIVYFLRTSAMRIAIDPLMAQLVAAGYRDSFGAARIQAIGERLPITDESVDVTICYNVLDHCSDPTAVLSEMRRILRRGGTMVLALHLIRTSFGILGPILGQLDPPHPYHFTRDQALDIAQSNGFRLEHERLLPKGIRKLALRDLISYNGIRHIGSSILTGSAGYFRFARD
jgi:SAM-dependent methyltransferase